MKDKDISALNGLMILWSLFPFGKHKPSLHTLPAADTQFTLYDNYPNPFSTITIIYFSLMHPSQVCIDITDQSGKKILTLMNEPFEAGVQRVPLYKISNGVTLQPGSYTYTVTVTNENGRFKQNKFFVLL